MYTASADWATAPLTPPRSRLPRRLVEGRIGPGTRRGKQRGGTAPLPQAIGALAQARLVFDQTRLLPLHEPLDPGASNALTDVAFSHDVTLLATTSSQGALLWNTTTGRPAAHQVQGRADAVYAVAFSPNSPLLATAGDMCGWETPPPGNQPNTSCRVDPMRRTRSRSTPTGPCWPQLVLTVFICGTLLPVQAQHINCGVYPAPWRRCHSAPTEDSWPPRSSAA